MDSNGRKIHGQAAKAREAGNHLESFQLGDEAMLAYQKDGNVLGFAEVIADRSIVLRHLADETGDQNFLLLAKSELEAAVTIVKKSGDQTALAIPIFNLAKIQEELGEIEQAAQTYQEAVESMENNPPELHNRPAVLADMKAHLSTCQYKNGDTSALERAEQALSEIETSEEVKYNKDVWTSGAHMRMADILRNDNPEKAKEHLQKAKEIIDANPDLKLRAKQWEKLSQSMSS